MITIREQVFMNKFIRKIILFFIPIICLALVLEITIQSIPNEYKLKRDFVKHYGNSVEVVILGSSHAYYGINPEYLSKKAVNLAHVSQTIDIDYKVLSLFKDDLPNLKYLIIPVDYLTFALRLKEGKENWRIKNYHLYYRLFLTCNPKHYSEILMFNLRKNLGRVYAFLRYGKTEINCNEYGFGNDFIIKKSFEQSGKEAAERHTAKNKASLKKNAQIIHQLIELARKNNIKIIFYTTPAYQTYIDNLDKKQLDFTLKTIQKIAKENDDICYYQNYLQDKRFTKQDFRDADHLNAVGAKKLTRIINNILSFF